MVRAAVKFLAVVSTNPMLAIALGGYRRDTSRVLRKGSTHYGFVIDVYPGEKKTMEAAQVLGEFATVAEAYERLEDWVKW